MNSLMLQKFLNIGIESDKALKPFWNRAVCPKCNEIKATRQKDMAFNMTTGQYVCHKCSYKGSVLYRKENYVRPKAIPYKPSDKVQEYFLSRGISANTYHKLIKAKMLVPTERGEGFYFLYYREEEYINFKARSLADKKFYQQSDGEKILFNINSAKGKTKAIIMEGEMSVFACIEAGLDKEYALLSLENGSSKEGSVEGKLAGFRNCYSQTQHIKEWIIALDDDQAGVYTANELIKVIGEHKCKIIAYPDKCKDPDDVINRNNRGSFTVPENNETLRKMIHDAVDFPVSGIIQLNDKLKALLLSYKQFGRPKAVPVPMMKENFAFKRGDLTVLSGYANQGKTLVSTTFVYLTMMEYQWKWAVFSGEQHPQDRYFEDLAWMVLKKPVMSTDRSGRPIEGCATPEEYEAALEFISNHVYMVYPERGQKPTLNWIMEKVLYLKSKYGINGVVLDTFNKLKHDFQNKRDDVYLDDWLDECLEYAHSFDAFILLMHPSKPLKTKSGKLPMMTMYDIAGGAMTPNKVDNIIIYHREENPDTPGLYSNQAEIKFEKIRDQKTVGTPGTLKVEYDAFKNCFKYTPSLYVYSKTLGVATDQIIRAVEDENYLLDEDIPF